MLAIFKRLTGGNVTVEELKGALAALDIEGTDKAIQRAEGARRDAILSGDEGAVGRAESALTRARLEAERLQIAKGELEARLARAEAAEARAARDKAINDAAKGRDAARRRLATEGAEAARRLVQILEQVAAANAEVEALNNQLIMSNPDGRAFLDHVEPGFSPWSSGVVIPPDAERGIPAWNHRPTPFPLAKMIEGAFPPGSTGDRGEVPRAVVLRPGGASATW